jgi:hypothetical protein
MTNEATSVAHIVTTRTTRALFFATPPIVFLAFFSSFRATDAALNSMSYLLFSLCRIADYLLDKSIRTGKILRR